MDKKGIIRKLTSFRRIVLIFALFLLAYQPIQANQKKDIDVFLGVACSPHWVKDGEFGYYIEENLDIRMGDKVLIIEGNIYIIDRVD